MINKETKSVLLVLVMLVAAVGGGMAATYDNETTNTGSTSDLVGGETVTDLDNASANKTLEVQSANASSGDDFTLRFIVNDSNSDQDGKQIYVTNASWTATNSSQGHYKYTFNHAEVFEKLERDAGENVTIDVKTIVNESTSSEDVATIQVYAQNSPDTAVGAIYGNEKTTSFADSTGIEVPNPFSNDTQSAGAAKASEDVGVNATNTTTVRLELENTSAADSASAATSESETGDMVLMATTSLGGEKVPVFYESAGASWIDTSTDTYATIDSQGDTITYHNVNESVSSDGTVTFQTTVNDQADFWTTWNTLGSYDISTGERASLAMSAIDSNTDAFDE